MTQHVTILGDGAMGTLCSILLAENRCAVRLWSAFADQAGDIARDRENRRFLPGHPLPDAVKITADDAEALDGADLLISAVPTQFVRGVWERLRPHCLPDVPICSVAKGIENETLLRPTEIIRDVLKDERPLAVLSGPSIAPEIAEGLPATVTVASCPPDLAEKIQQAIARPHFRVYTNPDLIGVELAGATKNVIAIAAGVLDGLQLGDNAKAALLTRGLAEITRLGLAAGGKSETFSGLAGMGDLVTTCFSPVGRNRSFGEQIGRGMSIADALGATNSVVEGVATTKSLLHLAEKLGVEMPIARAVHRVLFDGQAPRDAIHKLMTRPLRSEADRA